MRVGHTRRKNYKTTDCEGLLNTDYVPDLKVMFFRLNGVSERKS